MLLRGEMVSEFIVLMDLLTGKILTHYGMKPVVCILIITVHLDNLIQSSS